MDLNTYFALAVLLTPGMVMIMLRRCVTPIAKNYFSGEVINFVWYSVLNTICYVGFAPLLHYPELNDLMNIAKLHTHLQAFIAFTFLLPIILGIILGWLDKLRVPLRLLNFIFHKKVASTIPTMWEEIFNKNLVGNITVKLKNGNVIQGMYANGSGVSSCTINKDLYISQITQINNTPVSGTQSMWINGNEIIYISFEKKETTQISNTFILAKGYEASAKILKKLDDIFLLLKKDFQQKDKNKGENK